ncbi:MAG: hypothetical protein KY447_05785 [Actinobacteria bacterium]|nr:hypothetical protein [Actinomycetota bacterium]
MLIPGSPAAAESRSGGAYINDEGNPTAESRSREASPGRPARSGSSSNCTWRVVNRNDNDFWIYDADGSRLQSETGRWLERWCDGEQRLVNDSYAAPERARRANPRVLAQEARESVAIPAPPLATSPQADRSLYTGVRTWLWIDPQWWRGYEATAEAGGVSTTVSARPVRAVWSMGDGGQTSCAGPGVAWRRGMADDATYCSYVYNNSSAGQPGGTYTMTVTVEFEVSWTSNAGAGGSLARVTRSASRQVRVGEIQAVETQ